MNRKSYRERTSSGCVRRERVRKKTQKVRRPRGSDYPKNKDRGPAAVGRSGSGTRSERRPTERRLARDRSHGTKVKQPPGEIQGTPTKKHALGPGGNGKGAGSSNARRHNRRRGSQTVTGRTEALLANGPERGSSEQKKRSRKKKHEEDEKRGCKGDNLHKTPRKKATKAGDSGLKLRLSPLSVKAQENQTGPSLQGVPNLDLVCSFSNGSVGETKEEVPGTRKIWSRGTRSSAVQVNCTRLGAGLGARERGKKSGPPPSRGKDKTEGRLRDASISPCSRRTTIQKTALRGISGKI